MPRNATETFDGLVVGYGTHTVDNEVAAAFSGSNGLVTMTQEIEVASLLTVATATSYPNASLQAHIIPRGSIITGGYVQCLVALVGGTGDFNIGTWSRGLAAEVVDVANGLVDALLVAEFANVGDVSVLDGAMIADAADSNLAVAGAVSDSDVIVTYEFDTVFTAGLIRVVVTYMPPTGSISPLLV